MNGSEAAEMCDNKLVAVFNSKKFYRKHFVRLRGGECDFKTEVFINVAVFFATNEIDIMKRIATKERTACVSQDFYTHNRNQKTTSDYYTLDTSLYFYECRWFEGSIARRCWFKAQQEGREHYIQTNE